MTALFAVLALFAAAALISRGYTCLHTLQLEGYRVERYLRHSAERLSWRSAVPLGVVAGTLTAGALASSASGPWLGAVAVAVAGAVEASLYAWRVWRRPAKKPFVPTARMGRLIAATALVTVALAGLAGWGVTSAGRGLGDAGTVLAAYAVTGALFLAMPLIAVAAWGILEPFEAAMRRGFVARARRRLDAVAPLVIGIAGSYGKTTTKAALAAALSSRYRVLATPESYNTLLGVTRTINEQLADDTEVLIVEMGARHPGDIEEICRLVRPKVGLLTRLGPQHLEYFKSEAAVVAAKTELLRALPADGIAVVDADGLEDFAAPHAWQARTLRVSARMDSGAEALVEDVSVSGEGTSFSVAMRDGTVLVARTRLLGRHAAFNCSLAAVAALELGVQREAVVDGLARMAPVTHRLEVVRNDSVVVIDDAFSSNPEGFSAALEVLASFPGRHILITPGMIELGAEAVPAHVLIAAEAAKACDVIILVGRTWPPEFADALRNAGFPVDALVLAESLAGASETLAGLIRPGDVVLFENDLPDNFA
ncbi:MAG TPA: UDP-N-acetylmuramoyl-tripeptide--D-alanyl-D-alanine ligase [Coriobacteriia bacterium]|jgi:UDP-N-acetylmuramoyl-tripeptide--D-alanyl-D-alanine ligase